MWDERDKAPKRVVKRKGGIGVIMDNFRVGAKSMEFIVRRSFTVYGESWGRRDLRLRGRKYKDIVKHRVSTVKTVKIFIRSIHI